MFDDGDYRREFDAQDISLYNDIKIKHTPTNHTTPSSGIRMLNVTGNTSSSSMYSLTSSLNNLIKHIKQGNIYTNGAVSPTPKDFKIKLKLHQKRILNEMLYKESISYRVSNSINMFVLSDKVGSGKSIDMLALITEKPTLCDKKYLNVNNVIYKRHSHYRHKGFELKPTIIFKTNMIVIPHNIFNQWETYIQKYTDLSVYTINARRKIKNINFLDFINGTYQILLVKSTMYNDLMKYIYSVYKPKYNTLTKKTKLQEIEKIKWLAMKLNESTTQLYKHENTASNELTKQSLITKFKTLKQAINDVDFNDIIDGAESYTTQLIHIHTYTGPLFERVIFDEADSIKISNCEPAYGKINWFITSSVEDLLRPHGMWAVHSNPNSKNIQGIRRTGFIRDTFTKNSSRYLVNYIQDIYIKNTDAFVDKSFNLPEPIRHIIKCWTPNELKMLQGIAMPDVIQALNAGDTQTAISLTHCNIANESNIIDTTLHYLHTKLSECNEKLEEKNKIKEELELNIITNINVDEDIIIELKKKLKNIKTSLKLFSDKKTNLEFKLNALKERISNIKDKTCPICRDVVTNPCLTDCCKNIFCMGCYVTALNYSKNNQCAHCRKPHRKVSNLTLIANNIQNIPSNVPTLPIKYEKLIDIIKNKPDGKFLVFSQFSNSFTVIVNKLSDNNIPFVKLSGSAGRVTNIIKKFSNNEIKVLLLNANNYGSGLNLEMTTDIIIYHKMSTELEEQVIGRGQRLGRTGPLHVHYLYYEHEN